MHGKAQAGAWQRLHPRKARTRRFARGSAWFLFVLAFVAVYREVFETILFFARHGRRRQCRRLVAGGLAGLAAARRYRRSRCCASAGSCRSRKFFSYSSALIAVLAVVLAGKGVAALAGIGPPRRHPLAGFPRSLDARHYSRRCRASSAQAATLLALLIGFAWNRRTAAALGTGIATGAGLRGWHYRPRYEEESMRWRASTRSFWSAISATTRKSRSLNNGGEVVNMRVATSEKLEGPQTATARNGPNGTVSSIFNENLGRVAKSYLKKGSKVYLEGQIQTRKWQDQSGNDRYSTEVVLQRFRGELVLLDSREGGGGGRGAFNEFGGDDFGGGAPSRPQSRPQPAAFDTDLDDDVPF